MMLTEIVNNEGLKQGTLCQIVSFFMPFILISAGSDYCKKIVR